MHKRVSICNLTNSYQDFCPIFSIISTGAFDANKQLTILGKTVRDWKTSFANFELLKSISGNEKTALREFAKSLTQVGEQGQWANTVTTSFSKNISGLSGKAQEVGKQIAILGTRYRTGSLNLEQYETQVKEVILAETQMSIASKAAAIGLNLLINALPVIAISLIVSGISEYNRKLEETRQKQDEAAQSAKDETQKLEELYEKYKSLSEEVKTNDSVKSDLQSTTTELLKLLGIEEDQVDKLIDKYGTLDNVIDKVAYDTLVQSQADLGTNVKNKWEDIKDHLHKVNQDIVGGLIKDNSGNIINEILNAMGLQGAKERHKNVIGDTIRDEIRLYLPSMFDISTIEGIKQMYDTYDELLKKIEAKLGSAAYNNPFYQSVKERADELKPLLNDYSNALDAYDDNISRQMILLKKTSDGVPETAEAFEIWRNELVENAKANKSYFDDSDIEGSIDKALGSMAEFSQYMSDFSHTTENVKFTVKPTFDIDESSITESLTALKENIDDILKNADLFDKAVEAITKGESISFDDMMKLVGLDPSLADKFTQTANGYKATLEDLNEARQNYIQDTQDTLSESIKTNDAFVQQIQQNIVDLQAKRAEYAKHVNSQEDVKNLEKYDAQIAYQQQLLERVQQTNAESALYQGELNTTYKVGAEAAKTYDEILKDLANKESLLDSVHKELNDDGYISISTYQKLIEAGEDYADLVTIENGKLKLNEQALKDLTKTKYEDEIATLELLWAEENYNSVMSNGGISVKTDRMKEIEAEIEQKKKMLELWDNYTPTDSGGSSSNSKSLYSNELQLLKDDLNDGVITYEQFLQKWQALNDKYHAMSENDGGISDYEWGQNNRDIIAERTKAYEQEKARLKELYEAESITLEQYNTQLNVSLNHWLGGYTQLSSEYEKEVKSNTKELSEYRKKEYDDEIKDLKELYENGEITLEQLDSKMSESANHWLGGIAGLSDEFKDAVDDNYDYIKTHFFDKIDRSLDELEDEYERTGDISLLDKRETTINDAISQAGTELSKLYAKGLTEDNDDVQFWLEKQKKYNKDLESVLDERVDIVKDNVQETIETFDDEYEKSGDTAIFDKQISVYLQGQSDILNLIERYKDLGYSEESDAIKSLRKQYEEYGESIINVYDKITNAITDSVDKQIETIEEKFEKTGDVNTINDKISVYQSGKTAVQTQIDKLIAKGYSESSEEVQKLVKQLADYDKEIIGVYGEITNYIETQTDNQLKSIDELVALTGDTSALYRKIDVLNNGKLGIEGQIAKLLDEGYSESSEEVKSLYDKIKEYDNNILDVYSDIANRIDKETDKQLEIIDREIEKSGDTRQYQVRLNILADYKGQIQALIDELLKLGYDANSEIVQDLLSKIDSIDDDIRETSKDRIDAQVDAYEEVMSLESDQLEKYKDEQDEIFDGKIKALEDQKKALEDQSEEIEKQNELQEKQKNILDAQRGVMKSIRMIYSGNGQWTVSPTQESLENLKDAEKELEATQRKQQIEAIDKLIDGIEEQKKTFDDAIDEQTKAIQDGVDAFEKAMTDSYKVYAQLDYTLLKSILGEKDALKYYSDYNDVLAKNGVIDASMTTAKAELDDAVESLEEQSEANAKFTESTEQATKAVDTFAKKMQDEFGLGNVDLTTRPFVSGHKMRKAGYDVDPNGTSTVLSSVEYLWQGDEENGRYVGVHYTPILPNGEVLTDQELADYLHEVLEGSDDILKADNKGIILKIDDDLNLSEKDIRSLESGKLTKNMKTVLDAADAWDEALHNAQEKWMELWFAEYGNPNDSISAKAENIIDLFGNKVYGGILGKIQQILTNGSIGSLLPTSSEALNQFTPKTASDQSNIVNSNIFNPVITNNITINASSGNANDIRDAVKDVVDNRIIAGLKAFADGYNQSALNTMYGR